VPGSTALQATHPASARKRGLTKNNTPAQMGRDSGAPKRVSPPPVKRKKKWRGNAEKNGWQGRGQGRERGVVSEKRTMEPEEKSRWRVRDGSEGTCKLGTVLKVKGEGRAGTHVSDVMH